MKLESARNMNGFRNLTSAQVGLISFSPFLIALRSTRRKFFEASMKVPPGRTWNGRLKSCKSNHRACSVEIRCKLFFKISKLPICGEGGIRSGIFLSPSRQKFHDPGSASLVATSDMPAPFESRPQCAQAHCFFRKQNKRPKALFCICGESEIRTRGPLKGRQFSKLLI